MNLLIEVAFLYIDQYHFVWLYEIKLWGREESIKYRSVFKITNKNLLYSTGNSAQYSIITQMGKNFEKEYMYIYNWISFQDTWN